MNDITDDDLVLLYYGEHEDPGLAAQVARSPGLAARFETLSAELALADAWRPPGRGPDYGAEVWRRIAPRLEARKAGRSRWFRNWWRSLRQPRFSLAGALGVALVALLGYLLVHDNAANRPGPATAPGVAPSAELAGLDSQRLLSRSVADHLDQLDRVLTNFANLPEPGPNEAGRAMDLLVANRLYRQAAQAQGDRQLAAFLGELEPLLIEMAYEAYRSDPATRARMQAEVEDGLLFRVRVMNNELRKSQV